MEGSSLPLSFAKVSRRSVTAAILATSIAHSGIW